MAFFEQTQPGVKIHEDVHIVEAAFKAQGGLIRIIARLREGRIDDVTISGDFTLLPVLQSAHSNNPCAVLPPRPRPIFDYQSLPPLHIEGLSEPIRIFQPLGSRLKPGQVRGLPGLQVPMIGRGEQLDKFITVYNHVIRTKSSEIILCSGEAGIGKSRLVAEFRNYLSPQLVTIIQGTCALYMRITSYRVVADVLRNIMGISELDPINEQRKILQRHIEELGLDRNDILPYLLHVLGILHSDPVLEVRIKLLAWSINNA